MPERFAHQSLEPRRFAESFDARFGRCFSEIRFETEIDQRALDVLLNVRRAESRTRTLIGFCAWAKTHETSELVAQIDDHALGGFFSRRLEAWRVVSRRLFEPKR